MNDTIKTQADSPVNGAEDLIRHVLGPVDAYMVTWTKIPGAPVGEGTDQRYWRYPEQLEEAVAYLKRQSDEGRDAYFAVSPFKEAGNRRGENVADKVWTLRLDFDGYKGEAPEGFPDPTAYAVSSPGSYHMYFRLKESVPKAKAAELSRRLARWSGMDRSLAANTTVLRVPGTVNHKPTHGGHVVTAEITGMEPYDPDEFEALLPREESKEREPYDGPEGAGFDLEDWLARHREANDAIIEERHDDAARIKYAVVCPNVEEHSDGDWSGTYVGQYPNGALLFHCYHGHCENLDWIEYRRFYEEGDGESEGESLYTGVPDTVPELPSHTVRDGVPEDDPRARAQQGVFPVEVLPPVLRNMAWEVVGEMNVPPEYFAAPALATLAIAVGGTRYLNPKPGSSWKVMGNLSAATIAYSSDKKTPPYKIATAPARSLQKKLYAEYKDKMEVYEHEVRMWEAEKKALKKGEVARKKPEEPTLETVIADDFTSEVLAHILNENPRGILITDDELSGFFSGMDRYKSGGGNERQRHLKISTNGGFSVRRVSKEPIQVPNPVASYTGNIQPDMLPAFLIPKPGGRKGDADDGMLHRWLFAWPPQVKTIDSLEDNSTISPGAMLQYEFLYKKLRDLDFDEDGEPQRVLFTPEARRKFNDESYMEWQRRGKRPGVSQFLRSSYGKMAEHTARIALVLALCRNPDANTGEVVKVEDVEGAIAIAEYFAVQARKVQNALRREKEGKDERRLRVLNSLLDRYGNRWKVASAEFHTLMLDGGAYDVPDRPTELTKEIAALAERTPGLTVDINKRIGGENHRAIEITRDTPPLAGPAPEDTGGTVQDGSQDTPQDTPDTPGGGGLNTEELVLFALDGLERAYPKDLAVATGKKLKTVKNALTALRKEQKVEYTSNESEDGAKEVRLWTPKMLDPRVITGNPNWGEETGGRR